MVMYDVPLEMIEERLCEEAGNCLQSLMARAMTSVVAERFVRSLQKNWS